MSSGAAHDLHVAAARFVDEHVVPHADEWDRDEAIPATTIEALAAHGWLVPTLPAAVGGAGLGWIAAGPIHQEIGRGCGSLRNLLGVQGMVAHTLARWARSSSTAGWVERLARGEAIGAFALTEPGSGSDAGAMTTRAERRCNGFVLHGTKRWISFGAVADVVLLFARLDGAVAAFVVERSAPGLRIEPITGLLGLRGSALAELHLKGCEVPDDALLSQGPLVFGAVATSALDFGRSSTAWGGLGLIDACRRASVLRARHRTQFGVPIGEHQLIQEMIAEMVAAHESVQGVCRRSAELRDAHDPDAVRVTLIAKYLASQAAFRAAADAVQLHGAEGVGPGSVQRYLRDAKVQEIVEGTTQVQQLQIADLALRARSMDAGPGVASAGPDRPEEV